MPKNRTTVGVDLIDSHRSERYFVLRYFGAFLTTFVPKAACCYQSDLPMPTPKTNHTSAFRVGCDSSGQRGSCGQCKRCPFNAWQVHE